MAAGAFLLDTSSRALFVVAGCLYVRSAVIVDELTEEILQMTGAGLLLYALTDRLAPEPGHGDPSLA